MSFSVDRVLSPATHCPFRWNPKSSTARPRAHAVSQQWASNFEGPIMSAVLEPLALAPREAAAALSISKRSLSRLIRAGRIEARKARPRTLVDVASLRGVSGLRSRKKPTHLPIKSAAALTCCRVRQQVRH